jgi:predicted Zn-ribbon and HTH transcriptional regulator
MASNKISSYYQEIERRARELKKLEYELYVVRPKCSYCGWRPAEFYRFPITQDEVAIQLYACTPCFKEHRLAGKPYIWERYRLKNTQDRL